MRNLKLIYSQWHEYDGVGATLMTQHGFDENVSFVYDQSIVKSINHSTGEIKDLCSYEGVVGMEFVQLNDCLCLATESGEIIQYNFNSNEAEVVGLITDEIEAMSWSPDQELVVFVTKYFLS